MFSNLLFIIEIFVCGHLFAFRLKHRNKYALRLVSSAAICIGVGAFLGLFFVENVFYSFFVYIAFFAVSILALWFTYDEPIVNIFFFGIAAYTTQHFAYQFANLVFTLVMTGASPLLGIYHIKFFDITKLDANFLLGHLPYSKHCIKLRHAVSWRPFALCQLGDFLHIHLFVLFFVVTVAIRA